MKNERPAARNDFSLCAVSDTGVASVKAPSGAKLSPSGRKREIGLFYFIWIGADSHQSTNYCNRDILKNLPDPTTHEGPFTLEEWQKAGGGKPAGGLRRRFIH